MNHFTVIVALLCLSALAYQLGLTRSRRLATGAGRVRLHSRPTYHGLRTALWAVLPCAAVYLLWWLFQDALIHNLVLGQLPPQNVPADANDQRVLLQRITNLSTGFGIAGDVAAHEVQAAQYMARLRTMGSTVVAAVMAAWAALALVRLWARMDAHTRARNSVERCVVVLLIACSAVAILTTFGIVLSMLGEALRFFSFVNPVDFFFGTVWNPRFATVGSEGQGRFGLLPLLWGTLMVAGIAMLVAVPLGLLTAIYLSEYAPARVRAVAKPVIEVLAGIPTIVYGFFALVTMGPFLTWFGALVGLDIRATSALTAGMVMGIMIIPFVSSLSDDIITQVPRSLREGSYGLGATRSETITRVVLPAALPGIVGAILLAVSRAIGETMIVVLAAGNSPVLTVNPFEAVSTVTVTIVNQLTGDSDFSSPQSLVAFALGLTLFAITLVLNVVALVVVRRYREQYE